jgi:hypothetical protein
MNFLWFIIHFNLNIQNERYERILIYKDPWALPKYSAKCHALNLNNNLSYISLAWDYTVLSDFECFSMRTSIVEIKLVAHDSGSEYISWKTHRLYLKNL